MHHVIESELEEYLGGSASREFEIHLAQCNECRAEVARMQQVSVLLAALRSDDPVMPSVAFSARLVRNLEQRRQPQGFWGVFSMDPAFTRKIAVASLLSLAILGSFLATDSDSWATRDRTPEAVLASHDFSTAAAPHQHANGMLITLANYHQ